MANLRKVILLAVMSTAHAALAQIGTGTLVVLDQSKGKVVFSADSLTVFANTDIPSDYKTCKLFALKGKLVFASSGNSEVRDIFGIGRWTSLDVTKQVVDDLSDISDADAVAKE